MTDNGWLGQGANFADASPGIALGLLVLCASSPDYRQTIYAVGTSTP